MIFNFLALMLPVILGVFLSSPMDRKYTAPVESLADDWKMGGMPFDKKSMQAGDRLVLTLNVPSTEGIRTPAILMDTYYCAYEMYIDEKKIAYYGNPLRADDEVLPKKTDFVILPDDCRGKTIVMHVYATTDVRFNCSSFYYGDVEDLHYYYIQNRRLPILVGGFLIVFGFLLTVTIPFVEGITSKNKGILFHGPALLDLGLYFFCSNQLMGLVIPSPAVCVYIEHMTLYLLPFFIQCIISFSSERTNKSDTVLMAIDLAFPISAMASSLIGGAYISDLLVVAHTLMAIQSLIVIHRLVTVTKQLRQTSQDYYLYNGTIATLTVIGGLSALIISALLEIAVWYLPSVIGVTISRIFRGSILMYGTLLMTACMIASYFYYMVAGKNEETIERELEGIAYEDELTGLSNRAYCQQQMESYSRSRRKCTIINFDIDGLKQANDILGHQAGDRMIRDFADVLKKTFFDALLCGRMGGDEFVVVLEGEDERECENSLSAFQSELTKRNRTLRDYYLKASWGYAFISEEADYSARKCCMLADERMYRMKNEHKGVAV